MPMQAQQIVALATQTARVPGYTSQAGQLLNMILGELARTYDFAVLEKQTVITFSPTQGFGPYVLPADYLRAMQNEVFYFIQDIPQIMINIDLDQFHALTKQQGVSNYPLNFATDISLQAINTYGGPIMFVWPAAGGVFPTNVRYQTLPADIPTPETSTVIPWFPDETYLITRLSGELMKIASDARQAAFLGNAPDGAQGILDRFLKLQKDDEGRALTVHLDRRRFGTSRDRLPESKLQW